LSVLAERDRFDLGAAPVNANEHGTHLSESCDFLVDR
jgi:hypothetical protein